MESAAASAMPVSRSNPVKVEETGVLVVKNFDGEEDKGGGVCDSMMKASEVIN